MKAGEKMTLGSLFDGSGGFPLAGALCGVTPLWAAEVEPYPIAVTQSRFPHMRHLGDVSKVRGGEIAPVDIITFGSPCQDLSIAGKRAGLKHEANGDGEPTRSGLFMEAIRIIKEMRASTNGIYPGFAVWENVPGAFSSNGGEDFRIVLEEFVKIVEPSAEMPAPEKNGWPYADCYMGDGWSVAYRTLDAQYWGVPQRRRRIYLVADFRGQRAGEILFEREDLSGYFAAGGTPWEGAAADAQRGIGTADQAGDCMIFHLTQDPVSNATVSPCLSTGNSKQGQACLGVCISAGFKAGNGAKARGIGWQKEISPTISAANSGTNQAPAVCVKCLDARGNGDGETVNTLTGDHENRITDYTALIISGALHCMHDQQAVLIAIDRAFFNQGENAQYDPKLYIDGVAPTLTAGGPCAVASQFGNTEVSAVDAQNLRETGTISGTLQAKPNGGQSLNFSGAVRIRYTVRRLTPTECARLQGFPDRWGDIDKKEDFTEEAYHFWLDVRKTHSEINGKKVRDYTKKQMLTWYNKLHTDSAEYKMWGNGIALPTALYVMQGIAAVGKEVIEWTGNMKRLTS